jgi:hypothetical protein
VTVNLARLLALLPRLGNFAAMASDQHIAFGLAILLLFLAHVKTGRKRD